MALHWKDDSEFLMKIFKYFYFRQVFDSEHVANKGSVTIEYTLALVSCVSVAVFCNNMFMRIAQEIWEKIVAVVAQPFP